MKHFQKHTFSPTKCKKELREFKDLLAAGGELGERDQILSFFRERLDLSAFIASCFPSLDRYDLIAHEYDLFGDFICDLVIGESVTKRYLFVEFEDAKKNSLFIKKKSRETPEWSPRFEHGVSQVIDWFWKLADMERTTDFENRFGAPPIKPYGLVVLGRSQQLDTREQRRLDWRQDKVIVDSKPISCMTFDELCQDMEFRFQSFPKATET